MRKTISLLLVVIILGSILPPVQAASDLSAGIVSVSSGTLNVRSSSSTGSSVVASLSKGSYITLISKSGSWWYVEYAKGKYGYCHADYIKTVSGSVATVQTQSGNLNVRSGAGTSYAVKGSLQKGEKVVVLSTASGWSYVLYRGTQTGYVSAQYLSSSTSTPAAQTYTAVSLSVPSFKQLDSRWAGTTLGSSGKTIGQIGCATTAIAMIESYRTGQTIYPNAMAKKLSYTASGSVYWPSDYTAVTSSAGYLSAIYELLKQGKPVLFGAKTASGGQHWVVITGFTGGDTLTASGFTINDPGYSNTTLQQFLTSYPIFYKYFRCG